MVCKRFKLSSSPSSTFFSLRLRLFCFLFVCLFVCFGGRREEEGVSPRGMEIRYCGQGGEEAKAILQLFCLG